MTEQRTLQVTNARGDVTAEYRDFEPGQSVRVLPDRSGATVAGADEAWVFVGPTRHPYAAVIRETVHGTTVHMDRERLVAR
ncbi:MULTISPECIES: hypothetical protein [Mycolicibacterium]|jgi:hypothetical protein|uniref:hypothetical protein n=1 Tax=Mycolicibacterium TaxID=1866885 RepID=UPI001CDC6C11|nr:hypothetical protein [Mycolicibacterium fortuitum]UBV13087.1 hypothetical protein H8Z57_19695 [Mycolicibacterium fortuitum]